MEKKLKQLLLKDLCARLPYGVICKTSKGNGHLCSINQTIFGIEYGINIKATERDYFNDKEEIIKPYLLPLSSMTEEEKKELLNHVLGGEGVEYFHIAHDGSIDGNQKAEQDLYNLNLHWINFEPLTTSSYIDWLNAHHFDYRGLIPKGIAISTEVFNPYL